ncbi:UL36 very large tegument protein [Streptomyces sp. NPDC051704]|uniref:UL36 very large tegument protein n=1 Tax=Streptomyces sp. NPDC051704 TaxID=3365671 RepID=UPI0037BC7279
MTQRLDPGTGWYGEFLRRDPEGLRACLDGAAMPPWDVVESLLGDLAGTRGTELAAREREYAARLRAAAVAVWDRLPGGAEELRTLLAAAAGQRSASEAAARTLTARLGSAPGPAEAQTLTRELAWIQDDTARAAARHEDLVSRLGALGAGPEPGWSAGPGPAGAGAPAGAQEDGTVSGAPRQREAGEERTEPPVGRAEGRWLRGARRAGGARYAGSAAAAPAPFTPPPTHPDAAAAPRGARFAHAEPRAENRPESDAEPRPESHAASRPGTGPEPRSPRRPRAGTLGRARFTPPAPEMPAAEPEPEPEPYVRAAADMQAAPEPDARAAAPLAAGPGPGAIAAVIGELLGLRAQGRGGEAHALLCEAAAWPAGRLPALADELVRAGLAADWATLLWEAASLPPERLAAAAAALGEAGRYADCEALLRQGAARPAAEIAEAALALAGSGRTREADALLGAFVKVRTAEEAVRLARRDPQWFTPRLLRAAEALSGTHHRDLVHALRVAKPPVQ